MVGDSGSRSISCSSCRGSSGGEVVGVGVEAVVVVVVVTVVMLPLPRSRPLRHLLPPLLLCRSGGQSRNGVVDVARVRHGRRQPLLLPGTTLPLLLLLPAATAATLPRL